MSRSTSVVRSVVRSVNSVVRSTRRVRSVHRVRSVRSVRRHNISKNPEKSVKFNYFKWTLFYNIICFWVFKY